MAIDNANRYEVDTDTGCWNWIGPVTVNGYGQWHSGGDAHRKMYELHRGPLPPGHVPDHLCRNRRCVNPDHMEPVTQAVNCQRGKRAKLTEEEVARMRTRASEGDRVSILAREFGIARSYAYRVIDGGGWPNVAPMKGVRANHVRLPDDIIRAVRADAGNGMSSRAIAAKHGIGKTAAWRIAIGLTTLSNDG